jgi:hypothetical protein
VKVLLLYRPADDRQTVEAVLALIGQRVTFSTTSPFSLDRSETGVLVKADPVPTEPGALWIELQV